jgi:hypothetical protein
MMLARMHHRCSVDSRPAPIKCAGWLSSGGRNAREGHPYINACCAVFGSTRRSKHSRPDNYTFDIPSPQLSVPCGGDDSEWKIRRMVMKRFRKVYLKTLMASLLATGATVFAGTVSSASTAPADGMSPVGASTPSLYAQWYQNNDKRSYVRYPHKTQQRVKQQQMEKSEFAQFEEKAGAGKEDRQPTYRYVPGRKPPYVRTE